jgi:Ni,Fe-hydrogenase III small subunit
VVPSPRHADILLFTGAVTRAMRSPALRAWQSAPDPKICISYGACGNSGGIFHDLYCVWGGTDKIVPVDVYIPGCPPTPAATLYGFAMALGLLEQKIHARLPGELDNQPPPFCTRIWCSRCGCASTARRAGWRATAMAVRLPMTICVCWPGRQPGGALAGGGKRSASE